MYPYTWKCFLMLHKKGHQDSNGNYCCLTCSGWE